MKKISVWMSKICETPLKKRDWIIFGVIITVCFLCFQQEDLLQTAGSSVGYLNGHIFDFYEYSANNLSGTNYLPSSFLVFAIWIIPLKMLGLISVPTKAVSLVVVFWYKLLPCVLYLISGFIMYKICGEIGFSEKKSKLCSFVYLTTPIAIYSQFIFGQYDIFMVFLVLLGLYYYYKQDMLKFTIFFGIASTFKYFPLLIFIPLLLLREKQIWKIIKSALLCLAPIAIEILMYIWSSDFREGVFGFGVTSYIFKAQIDTGFSGISIILVSWMAVCGWAYFKELVEEFDFVKWSLYFSCIVVFLIFGLSMWHPQWLLFAVPFLVLSMFISKRFEFFALLDIVMMLFYVMYIVNFWTNYLDQNLFLGGIFGNLVKDRIGINIMMNQIFIIKNKDLLFSFFTGTLLISTLFKYPKYCANDVNESIDSHWGLVRIRYILGISIFIVPAFICLFVTLLS